MRKAIAISDAITTPPTRQLAMWNETKKPRPGRLQGATYQVHTPLGKAFVTINENGDGQPFEVFLTTAKAGSDSAAVSEAIGRMVSYNLRLASPVSPKLRLKEIWRQLVGIGGGRPLGFGPNRVLSLPDGVAQALSAYLEEHPDDLPPGMTKIAETAGNGSGPEIRTLPVESRAEETPFLKIGDLCPDCGQAAVINEEGCRKCYACGFSEC
jgi:ribonucleoside-diphosphate reductase alpha chain